MSRKMGIHQAGIDVKLDQIQAMDSDAQGVLCTAWIVQSSLEAVGRDSIAETTLELRESHGISPRAAQTNLHTSQLEVNNRLKAVG